MTSEALKIQGEVRLKPGREKSLHNRHPWIFSGAVASVSSCPPGALVSVVSSQGSGLGIGYYNPKSNIRVRMLAFELRDAEVVLRESIDRAISLRASIGLMDTDAYRLVNGEGDGIPGLIVDRYADYLVVQVSTLGAELLKGWFVTELRQRLNPGGIYEKSNLAARREEGLEDTQGIVWGALPPQELRVREYGINFVVDIAAGQKTGLFLDQREMRRLVGTLSANKRVLNCFSYSGGFSVYAASNGCRCVDSIDTSQEALQMLEKNFAINDLGHVPHSARQADVFEYLRDHDGVYDLIILDPPAFAKRRNHISQALRGYSEINRQALGRLSCGGILVTCSCSYFVDENAFQEAIFHAARDAGRFVRIIDRHHYAWDHPTSIFHPEGRYLKSLVLYVE